LGSIAKIMVILEVRKGKRYLEDKEKTRLDWRL
jgi:hypothetical protein